MKRIAWAAALTIVLAIGIVVPSSAWAWSRGHFVHARSHVFVGVGVGPAFWWGPPWWYYPPYPVYVYTPPPVIVQEQPPVYVQQPAPAVPPPPAPPAPPSSGGSVAPGTDGYWYYCSSKQAYYPTVQSCPEAWIKVAPRSQ
jgi:hypothetical protein